jgi:hypothetical protein
MVEIASYELSIKKFIALSHFDGKASESGWLGLHSVQKALFHSAGSPLASGSYSPSLAPYPLIQAPPRYSQQQRVPQKKNGIGSQLPVLWVLQVLFLRTFQAHSETHAVSNWLIEK